ncbi:MAG: helix-turn-helix domain-containing protein [Synechocystis sp.]|nr:helix-turn-helix domain-containing protein [Synechocystis sp.]
MINALNPQPVFFSSGTSHVFDHLSTLFSPFTGPIRFLPIGSQTVDVSLEAIQLPRLSLMKLKARGTRIVPLSRRPYTAITFVRHGEVQLANAGQTHRFLPHLAIGHNPHDPVELISDSSEMLVPIFHQQAVLDYAASIPQALVKPGQNFQIPTGINMMTPAAQGLYRSLCFLWEEFQQQSPWFNSPLSITEYENFLFSQLLNLQDQTCCVDLNSATSLSKILTMAETYISANLETSLTVEAIAAGVGVSPSTLFKTFKHQLDITPMQFVKRQKLEAARECLIKACPKTITVTEVALRYGFWNVGRFSKEYRQVFQESPAATLRR